jgi:hypothetical protein
VFSLYLKAIWNIMKIAGFKITYRCGISFSLLIIYKNAWSSIAFYSINQNFCIHYNFLFKIWIKYLFSMFFYDLFFLNYTYSILTGHVWKACNVFSACTKYKYNTRIKNVLESVLPQVHFCDVICFLFFGITDSSALCFCKNQCHLSRW